MNRIVIAVAVSVLVAGPAVASDKDDIMAVLKQWISSEAGSAATCDDDAAVIDDIPPYEWHGLAPARDGKRTPTPSIKRKE